MTPPAQPEILRAIRIVKPYHAEALVDGWLCIKYLDGGEESISTFADISKGDMVLYGNATRSRPAPLTQNDGGDCLVICQHCGKVTQVQCDQLPAARIDRENYEDLVYSSTPWTIYRQDAGMGEHDYAVFHNGVFFCRTNHSQTAREIIRAIRA